MQPLNTDIGLVDRNDAYEIVSGKCKLKVSVYYKLIFKKYVFICMYVSAYKQKFESTSTKMRR